MKTSATIEILREPEVVFEFTTKHVADWSKIVVSDETISEKPGGVGTTFRTITDDRGRRMEFAGEVTVHEPPRSHSVIMKGKQFDMEIDYFFKGMQGRTEVTQTSIIIPKGTMKILFFLFGCVMKSSGCRAAQEELENLKRLLEQPAIAP